MHSGTQSNAAGPPAPPSSVNSDDDRSFEDIRAECIIEEGVARHVEQSSAEHTLDTLTKGPPFDMNLLSDLLGSLSEAAAATGTSINTEESTPNLDMGQIVMENTDDTDMDSITTAAVIDGLRSLDEYERTAAISTEVYFKKNTDTIAHDGTSRDLPDSLMFAASSMGSTGGTRSGISVDGGQGSRDTTSGIGSFNEAELTAALEQLYWGSFDMPLVDNAASLFVSAPTPTPTPMSSDSIGSVTFPLPEIDVWGPSRTNIAQQRTQHTTTDTGAIAENKQKGVDPAIAEHAPSTLIPAESQQQYSLTEKDQRGNGDDAVEEDDTDLDEANPLELEELSLFSLFLSDMTAFESFLNNLSLHQLRKCAATVNSVLVRRESVNNTTLPRLSQSPAVSRPSHFIGSNTASTQQIYPVKKNSKSLVSTSSQQRQLNSRTGDISTSHGTVSHAPQEDKHTEDVQANPHETDPSVVLPDTTLSMLREWLPPSTADCVITALQAANIVNSYDEAPEAQIPSSKPQASEPKKQPAQKKSTKPASKESKKHNDSSGPVNKVNDKPGKPNNNGESRVQTPAQNPNGPALEKDDDGVTWLTFTYIQKENPQRHRIRIDIDRAPMGVIPSSFRKNNCVYPRACCTEEEYRGNRWNYETECNTLGWKLSFLNQELLAGRRGLIQTAVNNYRSTVAGRKSRRITRMEKAEERNNQNKGAAGSNASMKRTGSQLSRGKSKDQNIEGNGENSSKRIKTTNSNDASHVSQLNDASTASAIKISGSTHAQKSGNTINSSESDSNLGVHSIGGSGGGSVSSENAKCLAVCAFINSKFTRIRVHIDIGTIDVAKVDNDFKCEHAVYPRALNAQRSRYGDLQGRWEFELTCNELAWRLAWLNKNRLRSRKPLIQKCLDAYRARFSTPPWKHLSCYLSIMNGSVSPQFFDFWVPRPGKGRIDPILCSEELECAWLPSASTNRNKNIVKPLIGPKSAIPNITMVPDDNSVESQSKRSEQDLQKQKPATQPQPAIKQKSISPVSPISPQQQKQQQRLTKNSSSQNQHNSAQKPSMSMPPPSKMTAGPLVVPISTPATLTQIPIRPTASVQTPRPPQNRPTPRPDTAHKLAQRPLPGPASKPASRPAPRPILTTIQKTVTSTPLRPQAIRPASSGQITRPQYKTANPSPNIIQPRPSTAPSTTATATAEAAHITPAITARTPITRGASAASKSSCPQHPKSLTAFGNTGLTAQQLASTPIAPAVSAHSPGHVLVQRPQMHQQAKPKTEPANSSIRSRSTPTHTSESRMPNAADLMASKDEPNARSAKAQAAANVLTDVLRRFAKTDPKLAQISGVLRISETEAENGSDDATPIDAKVEELERLLVDLQKKD